MVKLTIFEISFKYTKHSVKDVFDLCDLINTAIWMYV